MTPAGIYVLGGDTRKDAWLGPLRGFAKAAIVARFVKQTLTPFMSNRSQADLVVLAAMMQAGQVRPVIDRRYALEQVAEAIRYQETGHARGKVVVTVN